MITDIFLTVLLVVVLVALRALLGSHRSVTSHARANTRVVRNNPVLWALGHIAPRVVGAPLHFRGVLTGPDGVVKQQVHVYNTVTTAGLAGIADQLLASPSLNKPTHMAVGTGTGGTTSLTTELDRNALTSKTRATATVTMVGDWAAGDGTGALTEAGVFDAASAGNMWLYTTFSVVNKGASDTFSIDWDLTIS